MEEKKKKIYKPKEARVKSLKAFLKRINKDKLSDEFKQ